jgi:hypothetical protein
MDNLYNKHFTIPDYNIKSLPAPAPPEDPLIAKAVKKWTKSFVQKHRVVLESLGKK